MKPTPRKRRPGSSGVPQQSQPLADALEPRLFLSVTFASPAVYTGVANPTGIAAGDLNGDGKPDVVVSGVDPYSGTPVVGVYLNDGNATFGKPTLYPFTGTPAGIALGDFTGSDKLDIAVVDSSTNTLDVFLDDGAGNFTLGAGASLGGTSGDTTVTAGDFNGDGKDDLAVVDPADQDVVTLFSNGDGSFTRDQTINVPSPKNIIVGDFTGDGIPDLAVLSGNGSIYVALNAGDGMFGTPVAYSLGSLVTSAVGETVGDFTGEKLNDLVGAGTDSNGGTFGELINQGAGVFASANDASTPFAPVAVLSADFDLDGNADLALLSASGTLTVFPGNGNGTFAEPVSFFANQPSSVGGQAVTSDFGGGSSLGIAYLSDAVGGGFGVIMDTFGKSNATLVPAVSKNTLPGKVVGGTAIHGSTVVAVSNSTTAAVKGAVTVAIYASSDGSVDGSSVLLGWVKKKLSLKADASAIISVPVTLPASLGAGTYVLLAQTLDPPAMSLLPRPGPA